MILLTLFIGLALGVKYATPLRELAHQRWTLYLVFGIPVVVCALGLLLSYSFEKYKQEPDEANLGETSEYKRLEQLARLRKKNIITEDEFKKEKEKILGGKQ